MSQTVEDRVAETVLQTPKTIDIGGKRLTVAPPSVATLILASQAISKLPQKELDSKRIVEEVLHIAKDCAIIGEICAILILGAKAIKGIENERQKRRFCLFRRKHNANTQNPKEELAEWLLQELNAAQLNRLLLDLLKDFNVGDFFGITTFLIGVNILSPTKVVETTASGL